jgi:hypothetical protein
VIRTTRREFLAASMLPALCGAAAGSAADPIGEAIARKHGFDALADGLSKQTTALRG